MKIAGAMALMWALGACAPPEHHAGAEGLAEPEPLQRAAPPRFDRELPPLNGIDTLPLSVRVDELEDPPSYLGPPDTVLPPLWTEVRSANLDMSRGQALEDRLEELPNDNQGVAVLTPDELFGSEEEDYEDGLCEPLGLYWDYRADDGGLGEVAAEIVQFQVLATPPEPYLATLNNICRRALDGATTPEEAVAAGDCTESDELTFFQEGTDCRDCLEAGGSIAVCEGDGSCPETAQAAMPWVGISGDQSIVVEVATAYVYSCAPNWSALFYLLSRYDEEPGLPEAFDSESWVGYCYAVTDDAGRIVTGCNGESLEPGVDDFSLAEGVPMTIVRIGQDEDVPGYWGRMGFAQSVAFTSRLTSNWFWGSYGDSHVFAPEELGGWGLGPTDLRPDGTDPEDPDDTFARDYVAAYTMKTSTSRNGAHVSWDNHNRCDEDAWVGPDERGRYRCTRMNPVTPGWSEDGVVGGAGGLVSNHLLRTIASTGLPDPDVPGGVAIHLACSSSYELTEGWSCPHTFEPDVVPYDDHPWEPGLVENTSGTGALEGEGYRFGKDPVWDIRVVMGSDWKRSHRPQDADGGQP